MRADGFRPLDVRLKSLETCELVVLDFWLPAWHPGQNAKPSERHDCIYWERGCPGRNTVQRQEPLKIFRRFAHYASAGGAPARSQYKPRWTTLSPFLIPGHAFSAGSCPSPRRFRTKIFSNPNSGSRAEGCHALV